MRSFDIIQAGCILLLLVISITIIGSVSPDLILQQITFAVLSLAVYLFVSRINYDVFTPFGFGLYILSILLLITPFFLGTVSRGSLRWIIVGPIYIQPSEIAKPILILSLSAIISRFERPLSLSKIIASICFYAIPALLIFLQPDLGSTLVLTAAFISIIIASGVRLKYLIVGLITLALLIPLGLNHLQEYQLNRLTAFIDPYKDPLGIGYNAIQSVIAVGSGGIIGRGLGRGTQSHLRFLPENHTDFIFASIAEELGLIGALIIIITYLVLFLRIFQTALKINRRFGVILTFGILGTLQFQTILNISMNIGMAPIAGVTLPLVSYGGSSLLSTLVLLGLIQNIYSAAPHSHQPIVIK